MQIVEVFRMYHSTSMFSFFLCFPKQFEHDHQDSTTFDVVCDKGQPKTLDINNNNNITGIVIKQCVIKVNQKHLYRVHQIIWWTPSGFIFMDDAHMLTVTTSQ